MPGNPATQVAARSKPLRRSLWALALATALIPAATVAAAFTVPFLSPKDPAASDPAAPSSVQDLRYGVVLYHFFQDEYFQALTELLLGEQKQDMPHHAEFAQLLRGGISLSYGMDGQARALFERLLEQHPQPAVRDRAWFYLGKNYYERGDDVTALGMLDRSGAELSDPLRDERDYLRAMIALQSGVGDVAAQQQSMRNSVDEPNPWVSYLDFNRGAYAAAAADWPTAAKAFDAAAATPLRDDEHKALRDRALVAAGYALLANGATDANTLQTALATFRQVRLNGPFSDQALLGYGWAALQLEDYPLALQPWQTLHERSLLSPAVQESLLAVPYAYEKLNASAQALAEYERAEQLFNQEISRIDAAQQQLRTASLLGLWLDPKNTKEWISRRQELPVASQLPYLEHLLALNAVQDAIRDLRDLAQLEQYLTDWQDRLDALDVAQNLQYQRRQKILQDRPDQQLDAVSRQLQQRRAELADALQQSGQSGDASVLMTAEELAIGKRLQRVRERIDNLRRQGQDVAEFEAKYQRYRGLLAWQAQDDFAVRQRAATRQLRELDEQLAISQQRKAQLDGLVVRARQPEQGARIRALQARLQSNLKSIQQAQRAGEQVLRERAQAELQAQRARLSTYLARTRLAKARLYDKGTTEALR
jgi:outer membrane protein assembly factor BamD (BamD/ComL family)